ISLRFTEPFSQGTFLAKVFLDKGLIHNHRSRRRSGSHSDVRSRQLEIGGVESAAGEKGNVQRLEEIWPYSKHVRFGILILGCAWPVEHGDRQTVTQERHHRIARRLHSRRF